MYYFFYNYITFAKLAIHKETKKGKFNSNFQNIRSKTSSKSKTYYSCVRHYKSQMRAGRGRVKSRDCGVLGYAILKTNVFGAVRAFLFKNTINITYFLCGSVI